MATDRSHLAAPGSQALELPPALGEGRVFIGERKVRLGDVDPSGRLRFDALTRYTQDVSDDDTTDAGLPDDPGWVVRSTVVDELVPAGLGERLRFATFCSGLGRRWAERRLSIGGDRGARYEVATVWVCVDIETGRPTTLTDRFIEIYGPAAGDRRVSARLSNPRLVDQVEGDVELLSWQLRATDFDVYGHVNNAAYWALVEQWLGPLAAPVPRRARLEYGQGLGPAGSVNVARAASESAYLLWWLDGAASEATDQIDHRAEVVAACGAVTPLPADLYIGADPIAGA